MAVYTDLQGILATNVVEIHFVRRNPKPGFGASRLMLTTLNRALLNSIPGKSALHFKAPTGPPPYNAQQHYLIHSWDIFMQSYRSINLLGLGTGFNIVSAMPVRTDEEQTIFWVWFNQILSNLSSADKQKYMNSAG